MADDVTAAGDDGQDVVYPPTFEGLCLRFPQWSRSAIACARLGWDARGELTAAAAVDAANYRAACDTCGIKNCDMLTDSHCAECARRTLEERLAEVTAVAAAAGWNGVTNSKFLSLFITDLAEECAQLAARAAAEAEGLETWRAHANRE